MPKKDKPNWIMVAETLGQEESALIVGLLKSADIPAYVDTSSTISAAFGIVGGPGRVFVPEEYYEAALDMLDDEDDDLPSIDEPSIIL